MVFWSSESLTWLVKCWKIPVRWHTANEANHPSLTVPPSWVHFVLEKKQLGLDPANAPRSHWVLTFLVWVWGVQDIPLLFHSGRHKHLLFWQNPSVLKAFHSHNLIPCTFAQEEIFLNAHIEDSTGNGDLIWGSCWIITFWLPLGRGKETSIQEEGINEQMAQRITTAKMKGTTAVSSMEVLFSPGWEVHCIEIKFQRWACYPSVPLHEMCSGEQLSSPIQSRLQGTKMCSGQVPRWWPRLRDSC